MGDRTSWAVALMLSLAWSGCGDGVAPSDGGERDAADSPMDASSGDAEVDASGSCGASSDADGDGHDSVACGGDDCDDADANRFPGNIEVCNTVDEDCDAATLGGPRDADADGDGFVDERCCNPDADGVLVCGDDCDDARPGVHPSAIESCNGVDDDCADGIDEGVQLTFHRDVDGDEFGVPDDTVMACSAPDGYVLASGDCDDTRRSINPSAVEACDGEDNDCDGVVDPGCPCVAGEARPCGAPDGAGGILTEGECAAGTQSCDSSGAWGACEGDVRPVAESCNGADDDCDASTDEGVTSRCWSDGDGDGYAPAGVLLVEMCGSCPLGTTAREPTGADVDCDDADRDAFPGQTSYFGAPRPSGGFDYDCDGAEVQRWTVRGRCAEGPGSGSCGGGCALTEGFDARRPAPACGASERWVSGCSCSDDSCLESTPSSRTQECR